MPCVVGDSGTRLDHLPGVAEVLGETVGIWFLCLLKNNILIMLMSSRDSVISFTLKLGTYVTSFFINVRNES